MIVGRNPSTVHAPVAAYTHQIQVSGQVRWLVLSGQLGQQADGTVPNDPVEQLEIALDNVRHNLRAAAMDVTDLVKLTFYLVGDIDNDRRRAVVGDWLNGNRPCTTLLYVAGLATPTYRVEIDAWACTDSTPDQ